MDHPSNGDDGVVTVTHDAQRGRFALTVNGAPAGVLDYQLTGSTATMVHTEVFAPFGGRGLGAHLVRTALDEARTRGWSIVPACSFVRSYLAAHPEDADLLVGPPGA